MYNLSVSSTSKPAASFTSTRFEMRKAAKNTLQLAMLALMMLLSPATINAQEKKVAVTTPELFSQIALQDSILFAAFNRQDMDTFKAMFTTDLEWYQDNDGKIPYETVFRNFEANFHREYKLNRQLVPGTLEVYPIKNYGAIEIGTHLFRHTENGKEETGTFKFVMIWKTDGGKWKISRVISFNH